MMTPQVAQLIAADRIAERQRAGCAARLAALARCCRPSSWTRLARRAARTADRLRDAVRRDRTGAVPCCTPA
jgi:hypothetical protein